MLMGDSAGARADALEYERILGRPSYLPAFISALSGDTAPARRWLTVAPAGAALGPNSEALFWLSLNEPEKALSVLERHWSELEDAWFSWAPQLFPAIAADPRFQQVLQRWREATMVR
jgi:hypothetical protein